MDFQVTPLQPTPPPVVIPPASPELQRGEPEPARTFSSNTILKWLFVVALILLIVSIAMLWFGGPSFREGDVVLKVEGPIQALSGDEATYVITYENHTKLDLLNMSFRFFYPSDSIVIRDGEVSNDSSEAFVVDKLAPGETGTKEIKLFL